MDDEMEMANLIGIRTHLENEDRYLTVSEEYFLLASVPEGRRLLQQSNSWLGRSPYLDEVVRNYGLDNADQRFESDSDENHGARRPYVQRYDSRGHPINPETRYRERMEVQAGNEVLQVAGIVETFSAREERERKEMQEKMEEKMVGLVCNRVGHGILTAGMWGVSGLRRRVMLYEVFSKTSFTDMLRPENYHGLSLITPGLLLSTVSDTMRYKWLRFAKPFSRVKKRKSRTFASKLVFGLVKVFGWGIEYSTTYMQMFALLQQLGLFEPGAYPIPFLHSFIPFSRDSLIQFPTPTSEIDNIPTTVSRSVLSTAKSFVIMASPITLVYIYGKVVPAISNLLFNSCYAFVLKPLTSSRSANTSAFNHTNRAFLQALKNSGFAPPTKTNPDHRELQETHAIRAFLSNPHPSYELRDEAATIHRNEALRLLEGGHANVTESEEMELPEEEWDTNALNPSADNNDPDSNNNSESTQVSWASMISVEVVDHGPRQEGTNTTPNGTATIPGAGAGANASAELHDATNSPPHSNPSSQKNQAPKPEDFHLTYLTMLPMILLPRTLSMFAARTIAIPLEILMVRTVASTFLRHRNRSPTMVGIYTPIFSVPRLGWKAITFTTNLVTTHFLVLAAGCVTWAAVSHASLYFRSVRVVSDRGPVEIEVAGEHY